MRVPGVRVAAMMIARGTALVLLISLAPAGIAQSNQRALRPPTWSRDVAPIFFKSCVSCHRPGGAAPFSLMAHADARAAARAIKDQVVRHEMPAWLTGGPVGEFVNDARLTDREIAIISAWVDAGTPPGYPADMPALPVFEAWQMGTPDLVVGLPKAVSLPASGPRFVRDFVLPLPFNEDKYVDRVEVRPGHPDHTHHVLVTVKDGANTNVIGGYFPGGVGPLLPAGVVRRIPRGTPLTLSIHYDPHGQVSDADTKVALRFARTPPQQIAITGLSSSPNIDIAANVADYDVRGAPFVFAQDSHIISLTPRMYERGKDFRYTLVLPDGTSRVILQTTRWKSDWQPTYLLKTPVPAPKGSRLETLGRFDNTNANEDNPDPKQRMVFPQEVMEGYFDYTIDAQKPPR